MDDATRIANVVIVVFLIVVTVSVVMMAWITAHDLLSRPCGGPS